jgi:hypothetical protein
MFGFIDRGVVGVLLCAGAGLAPACQSIERGTDVPGTAVSASFRSDPPRIVLSQHFALEVALCSWTAKPTLVRVDATMPEHRHGMNYRPTLMRTADGLYRAEGLLFHMPGRWQFVFEVRVGEQTERLMHSVVLD